jgi:hypothetical protein
MPAQTAPLWHAWLAVHLRLPPVGPKRSGGGGGMTTRQCNYVLLNINDTVVTPLLQAGAAYPVATWRATVLPGLVIGLVKTPPLGSRPLSRKSRCEDQHVAAQPNLGYRPRSREDRRLLLPCLGHVVTHG